MGAAAWPVSGNRQAGQCPGAWLAPARYSKAGRSRVRAPFWTACSQLAFKCANRLSTALNVSSSRLGVRPEVARAQEALLKERADDAAQARRDGQRRSQGVAPNGAIHCCRGTSAPKASRCPEFTHTIWKSKRIKAQNEQGRHSERSASIGPSRLPQPSAQFIPSRLVAIRNYTHR
jgi:hypothetical protein